MHFEQGAHIRGVMVFLQYQEIAKKLTKYQFAQKLKNGSA